MPELKPCPFCGNSRPTICLDFRCVPKFYFGYCGICGIKTVGRFTKEEAINVWNRRINNATD